MAGKVRGTVVGKQTGVCIVGCGLIGKKRAASLASIGARLASCADPVSDNRASVLALGKASDPTGQDEAVGYANWHEAIAHPGVDLVVVALSLIHI